MSHYSPAVKAQVASSQMNLKLNFQTQANKIENVDYFGKFGQHLNFKRL